jgi:calcineurin-like phosphoesterase family protein
MLLKNILSAKDRNETSWISKIAKHINGNIALIAGNADTIKDDKLKEI